MAKKPASKGKPSKGKDEGMSADAHRKIANEHHARARLHSAKADLLEAKNPPKGGPRGVY